jgi:Zn-dependent peptidase ImmA (M78 family)
MVQGVYMTAVNPAILIWARETAGLDLEAAAKKIGLNAARGVSGADRLAAFEAGNGTPSTSLLQKMSKHYRRPLLTFYLPKRPKPADYLPKRPKPAEIGQDFRTLPDKTSPSNILLEALLRDIKARQSLVRDTLEDDEDVSEVALIGSKANAKNPRELADAIVHAINFNRLEYRSAQDAFAYLRALVEAKGIFVLLAGDCGHWSTQIEVSVFRGFAIADSIAPFIVVNDQDAKAAWSFTLLHELAHLLLGETGISGGAPQDGIEQLCNDTAAAVLLASDEIAGLSLPGGAGDIAQINAFAALAHVSRTMIAYQLFRTSRITLNRWERLRDQFQKEWQASKEREKEINRSKPGGPSPYVVGRHRLGPALLAVARQGIADGSLTPARAGRMLGVKPMAVYPLLAEPKRVFG